MKLKYFLRGLGIGIIVTALLFSVQQRDRKSDTIPAEMPTDAPLVVSGGSLQTETPAISGQGVSATAKPESTPTATPEVTKQPESKKSHGKIVTFTVRSGLLSSSVARELKEAGIIKDAQAFDEYLEKSGYGKQVIAGKYKIPVGASYETIAEIITGKK